MCVCVCENIRFNICVCEHFRFWVCENIRFCLCLKISGFMFMWTFHEYLKISSFVHVCVCLIISDCVCLHVRFACVSQILGVLALMVFTLKKGDGEESVVSLPTSTMYCWTGVLTWSRIRYPCSGVQTWSTTWGSFSLSCKGWRFSSHSARLVSIAQSRLRFVYKGSVCAHLRVKFFLMKLHMWGW